MTKKILLSLLWVCALFLGTHHIDYALSPIPTMGGSATIFEVTVSGNLVNFSQPPLAIDHEILVPAQAFFESVGAQVYSIEALNALIAYRNNVFLKYTKNKDTYALNGLKKELEIPALQRSGVLFVPLKSAAQALNLNYTIDDVKQTIAIDYREAAYQYMQIGYNHYKRVNLSSWGISYYVPEYWFLEDGSYATYGFGTEYETYRLEPKILPLETGFDRIKLIEALRNNLSLEYGDRVAFETSRVLVGDEYTAQVLYYNTTLADITTHYVLYVFYENNVGYVLTGQYGDVNNAMDSRDIFDTIAKTFQINKLSINEQLEHYIELNRFFTANIQLTEPIYSNMRIENSFHFSGTVGSDVEGMHIVVAKENEQIEFYVPVIEGVFDATIYTPFGLGKHNITVAVDDLPEIIDEETPASVSNTIRSLDSDILLDSESTATTTLPDIDEIVDSALEHTLQVDAGNTALKFSVINVSSEAIKDLLPTEYVNYDDPSVYAASNAVTYNLTSNYAKARALYQWIYDQYTYAYTWSEDGIRTTKQLVEANNANAVELCVLYTGLLRANDIPARIVRGISENDSQYWVEAYINGKWLVADLPSDVMLKDDSGIHYFNTSTTLQYQGFESVEYLSF